MQRVLDHLAQRALGQHRLALVDLLMQFVQDRHYSALVQAHPLPVGDSVAW